jgi:hypothetical protein
MNCENIIFLLPLYIENNLNSIQSSEIEQHLMSCDSCMDKYIEMQNLSDSIDKFFDEQNCLNTEKEKDFFRKNLSAYLDKELSMEDYLIMTKIILNNKDAKKELDEMIDFHEKLQKSIQENKFLLNKNLSSNIVNTIKKENSRYNNELIFKTAIISFAFIILTLIIGYFSIGYNIDYFSKLHLKAIHFSVY